MFWYALLAVLAVLLLLSVALPVPRRIWAFSLTTAKYFWFWLMDVLQLRRMWFALTGRSAKYQKLSRPVLLRLFCEDMGPTFIKFGQIIASSAGMFPDAYVKEFQKVLDRVKPFPFADVKRTIALTGDQRLDLELRKTASRPSPTTRPKDTTKPAAKDTKKAPIGDNTLNPFEN